MNDQTAKDAHQAEIAQHEQSIRDLKNEISVLTEGFKTQKANYQTSVQDLEDEKNELATNLEKKTEKNESMKFQLTCSMKKYVSH